jgi:hypothetical protein
LRLVAACCRWPIDVAAIRAAAAMPLDWPRVVALTRRHRVTGFVHLGLAAAGLAAPPGLAVRYQRVVQRNMLHCAEATRIAARLGEAGIAAVFLKGVALAELAYGDLGVKQVVDNDLLVAPADVAATIVALQEAGYALYSPPEIDLSRLPLLMDFVKECELRHRATGAVIDLHWRMHSLRGLIDEPAIADIARPVTIGGKPVPTLTGEPLMIYLAIHGARHCWSRLKWLADFNALLAPMRDDAVSALRRRARAEGVGPCLDSALAQAGRLLGARVPDDVTATARVRMLVALSDRLLFGAGEAAQQTDAPGRYMRTITLSAIAMKSRPGYLAKLAWDMWVAPGDALAVPLPKPLRPLYLIISPARRMGRAAARLTRGSRIGARPGMPAPNG